MMSRARYILPLLILTLGVGISTVKAEQSIINLENPLAALPSITKIAPEAKPVKKTYLAVNALDMVKNPAFYLNKNVKIVGKFDKFSTLGLDYKPAMRSSEDYITFLIQRPDVLDHNIPLSEFKIFLKRAEAEKHIDLDAGDSIEFSGKIFSTALGDVWMDVDNFRVLTIKKKNSDKK
ncbi:hypothetical protein J6A31_08055 [bacterium]|nr:hypothetical protein [bacterium]